MLAAAGAVAGEPTQDQRYWSMFSALYSRTGSISGRVGIDLADPDHDLSGTIDWFKPASLNARGELRAGFSGQIDLSGGKLDKGISISAAFLNGGKLTLAAPASASLPAWSATAACSVNGRGAIRVTPPAGSPLRPGTLYIDSRTGLLSGSLAEGSRSRRLFGIVVPRKLERAGGFVLRGGGSGSVAILPPP